MSTLLREIQEDYELCLNRPQVYQNKVDFISNLFGLKGKQRLKSDNCPVYMVGKFQHAPIVVFALNPGYSSINDPKEEAEARKSWGDYQNLYLNFFQFFARNKFESPYYTALWHLLSGLTGANIPIQKKWELFDRYLINIELIPYHSEGILLPSKLSKDQFKFLKNRYIKSVEFISQFNPKLLVFNGNVWYNLLIKHNLIPEHNKVQVTPKFAVYFFKSYDIPCVLFDKFFQRHFWGITNQDRISTIPRLIHDHYTNLSGNLDKKWQLRGIV